MTDQSSPATSAAPWASEELKLFVLSAISLYFELLIVRWTNAYVINVGFFTNFLVLASFVGLGAGYLLAKRPTSLLPAFPLLLLLYCGLVHVARPKLSVKDPGALFWGEHTRPIGDQTLSVAPEIFVSVAYAVVALLFVLLGQAMGSLIGRLRPLRGYAANIAGSLLGIALYTANSFLFAHPVVWFGIVLVGLAPFFWVRRDAAYFAYGASILVLGFVGYLNVGSTWSPYYRTESKCAPNGDCILAGNGVWGMQLRHFKPAPDLYTIVHGMGGPVKPRHYENVLVIGAGGGNDVNTALHFDVGHVDAVEINGLVLDIGRELHPDKPYADPRVTTTSDDGRAFLRRSGKKYDLIVYGLPDSTGLVSSHANMRMESYLFTVEAFRAVFAHLAPDGVFALYNDYRQRWLIDKIVGMLVEANGQKPLVFADENAFAMMITGPGLPAIQRVEPLPLFPDRPPPATDDWPFLYLKSPHIPGLYLRALAVIGSLSLALIAAFAWLAGRDDAKRSFARTFRVDGPMFFMGAAFMLLEAKSIVTFGLLFGTTWLTTAMVIGGILLMVLGAIYVNSRFAVKRITPWAIALGLALALVYFVPPERFIVANPLLRYVVGAAAALSPVMFANVIFAKFLGDAEETPRSLASNLIGSVFGGIAEYLSLATGYRALLPVVASLYGLAFLLVYVRSRRTVPSAVVTNPP